MSVKKNLKTKKIETDDKYQIFLNTFLSTANFIKSATVSKLSRAEINIKRKTDDEFAAKYEEIKKTVAEVLEDEAIRRAIDGVEKDVYFKGEIVGTTTIYSDSLLSTLLKGNMPEKYSDKIASSSQDIASLLIKQLEKLNE